MWLFFQILGVANETIADKVLNGQEKKLPTDEETCQRICLFFLLRIIFFWNNDPIPLKFSGIVNRIIV